jgi:hypothetical protein
MSEALFPVLPGQAWPRLKTPRHATLVRRANGRRFALALQLYPTYTYKLRYNFLRPADLAALAGFFRARRGRLDDFLFDDRDDNLATDQTFGLGDGTTTAFQLVRSLDGVVDPVHGLNGAPVVKRAGSVAACSVSTTGLVTFASPPGAGQLLTWSGGYYWRCAFTRDEQEFEEFMRRLWSASAVEFETFRP